MENDVAVLDLCREAKPPFSPADVSKEFADVVKFYGLREVTGDSYGGQWPVEMWAEHGVRYVHSGMVRSDLYLALLPMIHAGQCELLDNRTLRTQLEGLDRKTARSGRDSVDHSPGGHDDVSNSAAGALVMCRDYQRMQVGVQRMDW